MEPRVSPRLEQKRIEKARQEGARQQTTEDSQHQRLASKDRHMPAGEAFMMAMSEPKYLSNRRTTKTPTGR